MSDTFDMFDHLYDGHTDDHKPRVIRMRKAMKKIELGQVVMTATAKAKFGDENESMDCLMRHQAGDWGDICDEDKKSNDDALSPDVPRRLMSVYDLPAGKLWIITEWDRSVTTLLLPEDY